MTHNRPPSRSLKELGIDVEAVSKEKRGKYLVEHPKGTLEQEIIEFFSEITQDAIKNGYGRKWIKEAYNTPMGMAEYYKIKNVSDRFSGGEIYLREHMVGYFVDIWDRENMKVVDTAWGATIEQVLSNLTKRGQDLDGSGT